MHRGLRLLCLHLGSEYDFFIDEVYKCLFEAVNGRAKLECYGARDDLPFVMYR